MAITTNDFKHGIYVNTDIYTDENNNTTTTYNPYYWQNTIDDVLVTSSDDKEKKEPINDTIKSALSGITNPTMRTLINKIQSNIFTNNYGVAETTDTTNDDGVYVVNIPGWKLVNGAQAIVKMMGVEFDKTSPIRLNINGTGDKRIRVGATDSTDEEANELIDDVYDNMVIDGTVHLIYVDEGGNNQYYQVISISNRTESANIAQTANHVPWSGITNKVNASRGLNGLMSSADKIKLDGMNELHAIPIYAVAKTTTTTSTDFTYTASIDGWKLEPGVQAIIKFSNIELNQFDPIKLNINNTGAKRIRVGNSDSDGDTLEGMYDALNINGLVHLIYVDEGENNQYYQVISISDRANNANFAEVAEEANKIDWSKIYNKINASDEGAGLMSKDDWIKLNKINVNDSGDITVTSGISSINLNGITKVSDINMYAPLVAPSEPGKQFPSFNTAAGNGSWEWNSIDNLSIISSISENYNKGITITKNDNTEYNIFAPTSAPTSDAKRYIPTFQAGTNASSGSWHWQEATDSGSISSISWNDITDIPSSVTNEATQYSNGLMGINDKKKLDSIDVLEIRTGEITISSGSSSGRCAFTFTSDIGDNDKIIVELSSKSMNITTLTNITNAGITANTEISSNICNVLLSAKNAPTSNITMNVKVTVRHIDNK